MTMTETQPKPLMVIGPVTSGKTTLLQALDRTNNQIKKTSSVIYSSRAIDTPGEMLSIPRFYNSLILNSIRACLVLFLMDGGRPTQLPSRMARALKAPVLGVINKIDIATVENSQKARQALINAGVSDIIEVSAITGQGLGALQTRIDEYLCL